MRVKQTNCALLGEALRDALLSMQQRSGMLLRT
jgi:hypothetical protein